MYHGTYTKTKEEEIRFKSKACIMMDTRKNPKNTLSTSLLKTKHAKLWCYVLRKCVYRWATRMQYVIQKVCLFEDELSAVGG